MVELLAYLAVFTMLTGTIVGAELAARRMSRSEGATLTAMYEVDRLFGALADDVERATDVRLQGDATLVLDGAATYSFEAGEVRRDGVRIAIGVKAVAFERPDAKFHPRLLRVRILYGRRWGPDEVFERSYERTFLVRNLKGVERVF